MSSDLEHWHIDAKVYDDRVEEIHIISDPARNIRKKPHTKVWHVEQYLGRGSFGDVRLEKNRNEGKLRAVKKVATSSATLSLKECEQELEALLEFSKPKSKDAAIFVEFFGWFHNGFNMYLAMEYIELGDLEKNVQLHSGKLPEIEAQGIAEQILSGLEIMHRSSFAHRDLKPQNVLVVVGPPQWWVKLADFGFSKRLTDSTAYRTLGGTLSYMAPEILNYLDLAASEEYTNAVDLWAAGCIIYRLMTGIVPFPQGKSLIRYCGDKMLFPNGPLIKCGITDNASKFVQGLLAIDPQKRLSAAESLHHHWIISSQFVTSSDSCPLMLASERSRKSFNATPIPLSALHPTLGKPEVSGSTLSAIEYDTVSHAGLKSYSSSISSKTSGRYDPETIVKAQRNNTKELAVTTDMPVERASNSQQLFLSDSTIDVVETLEFEYFKRQDSVLEKEAQETLESKHLLAVTLYKQKQYLEAKALFREVILGRDRVLGKEDPETLRSKHWLAVILDIQKQYLEANELLKEVILGRERVLRKEDPETLECKSLLAVILYKQKQYLEAKALFREIILGRDRVLGKEDPETLRSKHWLAAILDIQKQYLEANELLREVILGRERVLGKEDPETIECKSLLALVLYNQKEYLEAEELFREVNLGQDRILGKKDPKTLESKHWLDKCLVKNRIGRLKSYLGM